MRAFADFLVRLRKEKPLAVGLSSWAATSPAG